MENLPQKANFNISLEIQNRAPGTKTIDIRRKMAQVPEVAKALNKIEKYVFAAATKTQISEMTDLLLIEKTKQLFRFVAIDVGFTIPQQMEDWQYICARLMDILKRYYSNMTLADIKLAFELAATGELNEWLPKGRDGQADKNHYQQFNADYFSKILNAYKGKQSDVFAKATKALPAPIIEVSDKEIAKNSNEILRMIKDKFLRAKYKSEFKIEGLEPMFIYDFLFENRLANKIVITQNDKAKAMDTFLRRAMMGKENKEIARRIEKKGTNSKELYFDSFELARIREIKKAFLRMIIKGVNINDYLKFKDEN